MLNKRKNQNNNIQIKLSSILCFLFGTISLLTTLALSLTLYGQAMKLSMKNTTSMLEESAVQASNLVMESLEAKINMGRGLQNNIAIREYNSDWNRTLTGIEH